MESVGWAHYDQMATDAGLAKGKMLPFDHLRTWREWTHIPDQDSFTLTQGLPVA